VPVSGTGPRESGRAPNRERADHHHHEKDKAKQRQRRHLRISRPSGHLGRCSVPEGRAAAKFSKDRGAGLKWAVAMFDDARFDMHNARDVLGTRCGTSAVLAGLVSAKTREWTTLHHH
jgi:hypothetical protein